MVAAGDRRAHDDVFLAGIASKQRLKRGQERHEQRGSFSLADLAELVRHLAGNHQELRGPAVALQQWPWPVRC